MPEVTSLLEEDHREVEALFEEFQRSEDPEIVMAICRELTVHAIVEEEIVYPVLRTYVDARMAEGGEQEHEEAKGLIVAIERIVAAGGDPKATVLQLKGAIEHHVGEEEGEVFPKLREELGDELELLGGRLDARKRELADQEAYGTS